MLHISTKKKHITIIFTFLIFLVYTAVLFEGIRLDAKHPAGKQKCVRLRRSGYRRFKIIADVVNT